MGLSTEKKTAILTAVSDIETALASFAAAYNTLVLAQKAAKDELNDSGGLRAVDRFNNHAALYTLGANIGGHMRYLGLAEVFANDPGPSVRIPDLVAVVTERLGGL